MTKTAVLIPIFKVDPNADEQLSIARTKLVFSTDYSCIFVAPVGLDVANYTQYDFEFRYFNPEFFRSIQSYNRFMLNKSFYQAFLEFDYILVCQPDVYVFHNDLERFTSAGYEYVGAPWIDQGFQMYFYHFAKFRWLELLKLPFNPNWKKRIGNGGFSLRKVRSFNNWFEENNCNEAKWGVLQEDYFWSLHARYKGKLFYTPSFKEGCAFALETKGEKGLRHLDGKLPMAVHAWRKYDPLLWEKHIK